MEGLWQKQQLNSTPLGAVRAQHVRQERRMLLHEAVQVLPRGLFCCGQWWTLCLDYPPLNCMLNIIICTESCGARLS
jgi:hypothetical protein